MGRVNMRLKVFLGVLVAAAAVVTFIACGSDENGVGPENCVGASCDGGTESSTTDGPSGTDGTIPTDGGLDGDAADGDSSVVSSCDSGAPGTLDESFGDGGLVWLKYSGGRAFAVAVQGDGKIVVAGGTSPKKFALVRLLADGTLDPAFGTAGLVETTILPTDTQPLRAVVIQPDGKIVAAGPAVGPGTTSYDFVVLRYNTNGSLDPAFGDAGAVVTDFGAADYTADYPRSVALQPDGRILVGGYSETGAVTSTGNLSLARYNADGSLDTTFGTGGRVTLDVRGTQDLAGHITVLPSGKIVFAGSIKTPDDSHYELGVLQLNANGSIDTTFADAGTFVSVLGGQNAGGGSPVSQPGGRLVVGGLRDNDFVLVGLTPVGAPDPTFGVSGVVVTDFAGREDAVFKVVLDDGKITAAGMSQDPVQSATRGIASARYDVNGALDPTFGTGGKTVTLPPPNADLGGLGAATSGCTTVVVGSWSYNQNTITQLAMGVARYHR